MAGGAAGKPAPTRRIVREAAPVGKHRVGLLAPTLLTLGYPGGQEEAVVRTATAAMTHAKAGEKERPRT